MPRQTLTLGGAVFTPFTGLAQPYSTNYTPSTSDLTTNFTGAISPVTGTGRPLMVSSLTVKFRSGGGSGFLFCSTDSTRTGSVTSTSSFVSSFNGDVSRVLDYPALINDELYYGFDKSNTTQTNYSTDTESGSNVYSNGSLLESGRAIFAELQFDTIPSAVQSLSANATGSDRIAVSWSAPSDNGGQSITGYQVAYKRSTDSTYTFTSTASTSITLTGLSASTTYDIVVGAKNGVTARHNAVFGYSGAQAHTGTAATAQATTQAGLPNFTDLTLANATKGDFYSDEVQADNATSYTLISGMPSGLSLNTNNGSIDGTPSQSGSFSVVVDANNSNGSVRGTAPLTVNPGTPVWIDQTLAGTAFVDAAYNDGVEASEGASYQVSAGSLPNGISLNTSSGAVTGTPTTEGTSNFTIQAFNVTGTISAGFTIEVVSGLQPPTFTDDTLSTDLRVGIAYSDSVSATNADAYNFVGSSVPGLAVDNSGNVTGTPTAQGTFDFDIVASNAAGSATANFSLPVKPGAERYDGTAFQRVGTFKRYDGTAFVDVEFVKRYDGTAWVDANL